MFLRSIIFFINYCIKQRDKSSYLELFSVIDWGTRLFISRLPDDTGLQGGSDDSNVVFGKSRQCQNMLLIKMAKRKFRQYQESNQTEE